MNIDKSLDAQLSARIEFEELMRSRKDAPHREMYRDWNRFCFMGLALNTLMKKNSNEECECHWYAGHPYETVDGRQELIDEIIVGDWLGINRGYQLKLIHANDHGRASWSELADMLHDIPK